MQYVFHKLFVLVVNIDLLFARNVFSPFIPKPVKKKNITITSRINVFMSWPSVFWKANGASLSLLRPEFQSQISTYGIFG